MKVERREISRRFPFAILFCAKGTSGMNPTDAIQIRDVGI